jgi:taurine transport system permease protein
LGAQSTREGFRRLHRGGGVTPIAPATTSSVVSLREDGVVTTTPVVTVDGLVVTYSERPVLGPIDLTVDKGEFVVVVGASGCGKSTLLNAVGGHVPYRGSVRIGGARVDRPMPAVATVFQRANLFPWLRVIDNAAFGLKMQGVGRRERLARAEEVLAMVGLEGVEDRPPYELSGGMQQRVALARALAGRPSLLLMDEPFAALDAITRARMQTQLTEIWSETATTVIFITHDVDEALLLGQRVVVLGGTPGQVRHELVTEASGTDTPQRRDVLNAFPERARILRELEQQAPQEDDHVKPSSQSRRRSPWQFASNAAAALVLPIAAIALWFYLVATEVVSETFLPSPSTVWDTGVKIFTDGYRGTPIWSHIYTSLSNVAIAFVIVAVVAVPLGFLMGLNRSVQSVFDPLVEFIRPLPPLAYLTLLVIWLGIGQTTQVTLLAVTAFPILTAAARSAALSVPLELKKTARSFGAGQRSVFREVILPASVPEVLTGLRVVVGIMFATVIAAEMVAARGGIGWMILDASRFLRSDVIFVGIFIMVTLGFTIDRVFRWLERVGAPWRGRS